MLVPKHEFSITYFPSWLRKPHRRVGRRIVRARGDGDTKETRASKQSRTDKITSSDCSSMHRHLMQHLRGDTDRGHQPNSEVISNDNCLQILGLSLSISLKMKTTSPCSELDSQHKMNSIIFLKVFKKYYQFFKYTCLIMLWLSIFFCFF